MVKLSERQKVILTAFFQNKVKGVALDQLKKQTKASRRTIYREFNELSLYLDHLGLKIRNEQGRYRLKGAASGLTQLQELLGVQTEVSLPLKSKRRQNALAALLLLADEPQKIVGLALELDVSENTIKRDLNILEEALADFAVEIKRKKGSGVWLQTTETIRRQILCEILLNELNDYQFFEYLTGQWQTPDIFLRLLPRELLVACHNGLKKSVFEKTSVTSDQQTITLILYFALSLFRSQQKHYVTKAPNSDALRYQALVYRFLAVCELKSTLPQGEVNYLAEKLQQVIQKKHTVDYENEFELSISLKVKDLIALVSKKVKYDFARDPLFFKKLATHIVNLIQNEESGLPDVKIEMLERLQKEHQVLFLSIKQAWQEIFFDKTLTETELQLILLYFASQLTTSKKNERLAVLVICENGIGTSSILKQRLKKELPQIKQIKIAKVFELAELSLKEYDVVLSTLMLPGFPRDYQIVSPLLTATELKRLKEFLAQYQKEYLSKASPAAAKEPTDLPEKLAVIAQKAFFCSELVSSLTIKRLEITTDSLPTVIAQAVAKVSQEIITDRAQVTQALLAREKLAPIGLPESSLALLHTVSSAVTQCHFMIFDLTRPLPMLAMDQTKIAVTRFLLILGPKEMSDSERETLGSISSMIIMSDQTLALFTSGTKEVLQTQLAKHFLKEIKSGIPI